MPPRLKGECYEAMERTSRVSFWFLVSRLRGLLTRTVQMSQTSFWFLVSSFFEEPYHGMLIPGLGSLAESNGNGYRDLSSNAEFPREEIYGLTSQIRRSAVSVASNIAEGQGRLSRREFRQFLEQARGSLLEMETQVVIAGNLGYLSRETVAELMNRSGEVSRLLHRLIQSLQPAELPSQSRN